MNVEQNDMLGDWRVRSKSFVAPFHIYPFNHTILHWSRCATATNGRLENPAPAGERKWPAHTAYG